MGKGIDLAREFSPEHAAVLDNFKDQLLIVLLNRLGGKVTIPVAEVDTTGGYLASFNIENGAFNFVVSKKQ
jgi:hypothetical protein